MNLRNNTKSQTTLFLVLAITFFVLSLVLYSVLLVTLKSRRSVLDEAYRELLTLGAREVSAKGAESLVETLELDIQNLDTHIVERSNIVALIQDIESLGLVSNTRVEISSVETEGEKGAETQVTLRFVGVGSWSDIIHLLALTEGLPLEKTITTVGMRHLGDEVGWSLTATLVAPLF